MGNKGTVDSKVKTNRQRIIFGRSNSNKQERKDELSAAELNRPGKGNASAVQAALFLSNVFLAIAPLVNCSARVVYKQPVIHLTL